jgi:hypothetical protein
MKKKQEKSSNKPEVSTLSFENNKKNDCFRVSVSEENEESLVRKETKMKEVK